MSCAFVPEEQGNAKAFCLLLIQKVVDYFRSSENQEKFNQWYEQKHGGPYRCDK